MAKRRDFMIQFSFHADRAGEFFKLFAPFMEHAENFECTTVTVTDKPVNGPEQSERGSVIRRGNPTTSEAARERFRIAQRGNAPTAREILTAEFGTDFYERKGRDYFLINEAVEALTKRGLSERTAAPTLNNMKAKGQAEHVDTNKYRLKPEYLKSMNGGGYSGTGTRTTSHTKGL